MTTRRAALLCVALLIAGLAAYGIAQNGPGPDGGPMMGQPPAGGPDGQGRGMMGGPPPGFQGPPGGKDGQGHGAMMGPQVPPQLGQMIAFTQVIKQMSDLAKDPAASGMIAVAGLKDDVHRPVEQVIADLEKSLEQTKSLPLRNSIRLTLKDLYKQQGQDEKGLKNLHEMLSENDKALYEMK